MEMNSKHFAQRIGNISILVLDTSNGSTNESTWLVWMNSKLGNEPRSYRLDRFPGIAPKIISKEFRGSRLNVREKYNQFDNVKYLQLKCTAMSAKTTQSYANLAIRHVEVSIICSNTQSYKKYTTSILNAKSDMQQAVEYVKIINRNRACKCNINTNLGWYLLMHREQ